MSDAWFAAYTSGDFTLEADSFGSGNTADPRLVLGTVLDVLTARGVPVVVDRLDRALEDIGRLLRDLGVEATDAWTTASWTR